jgi:hypothetical protein
MIALVLALVLAPSLAHAQNGNGDQVGPLPTRITIPAGMPIYTALNQLVLPVFGLQGPTHANTLLDEKLEQEVVIEARGVPALLKELTKLLPADQYNFWIDQTATLQVTPKVLPKEELEERLQQLREPPQPAPIMKRPVLDVPQIAQLEPIQPMACDQRSWMAWFYEQATHAQQEWFRTRRERLDYNPYFFGDRDCRYITPIYSYRGVGLYNGVSVLPSPYYPAVFPQLGQGSIKTSGDVRDVELFVEGCYIGDAASFNNWFNQKSSAVANVPLQITARRRDGRAFSRTVLLSSILQNWATGARHLPFGIEDYKFEEAGSFLFDEETSASMDEQCRASPQIIR